MLSQNKHINVLKMTHYECVLLGDSATRAFLWDWRQWLSHLNNPGNIKSTKSTHNLQTDRKRLVEYLYMRHWAISALISPNADASTVGMDKQCDCRICPKPRETFQPILINQGHIHVQLLAAASASLVAASFLLPSLPLRLRLPFRKLSAVWRWKCFLVPTREGLLTRV